MIKYHSKMREYQKRALEFACNHPANYQAVDLGLGKTLVALQWLRNIKPGCVPSTLVFAPLRVATKTWPDEIRKWAPDLSYRVLHGPHKDRYFKDKVHIHIINYEGIKWLYNTLRTNPRVWGKKVVIFDEAARIKDPSTKRFKILGKIQKIFSEYRMALSGEPAPNGLHELWSQYKVLGYKQIGRTYTSFRDKYFIYNPMSFKTILLRGAAEEIFELVKPITFRLDANDYKLMPDVVYNTIKVDLPKQLWPHYVELETDFYTEIDGTAYDPANAMVASGKLRQFVQGAMYDDLATMHLHSVKAEALKEIIESNPGKNILCAIQYRFELEILKRAGLKFEAIVGGVSASKANDILNRWNKKLVPLLVCHPASLSEGLNLQYGGSIIVWLGLPWNPAVYRQLNGRLIRPDQKHTVVVNNIAIDNTIDSRVAQILSAKTKTQQELLDKLKESQFAF